MNDLPAVKTTTDYVTLGVQAWDDLIARLTLAEARLAAHHEEKYDTTCTVCNTIEEL